MADSHTAAANDLHDDLQTGLEAYACPLPYVLHTHVESHPCLLSPPAQAGCPLHFTGMTLGSKVTWLICCSYSAWLCLCMSGFLLHWASGHILVPGSLFLVSISCTRGFCLFLSSDVCQELDYVLPVQTTKISACGYLQIRSLKRPGRYWEAVGPV